MFFCALSIALQSSNKKTLLLFENQNPADTCFARSLHIMKSKTVTNQLILLQPPMALNLLTFHQHDD